MVVLGCLLLLAAPPGDPVLTAAATDHLSRAADCLQRGDRPAAAGHLAKHVRDFPDQLMVRAHLAELLFRERQYPGATAHYERFVAAATDGPPRAHLVHAHTRLMQAAEATDDPFREHLHRGLALVRLSDPWPPADPPTRDALCKAAASFREASEVRPTDPRPWLYLAGAYARLGQPGPAAAAVRAARDRPPVALSGAEERLLAGLPAGH